MPQDVIGTYLLPVEGVPGAFHIGVFYARDIGNGQIAAETFEAYPTNGWQNVGTVAATLEVAGEAAGLQNGNSPFGPISYTPSVVTADTIQLLQGATDVRIRGGRSRGARPGGVLLYLPGGEVGERLSDASRVGRS
jgi:hypothetical protein